MGGRIAFLTCLFLTLAVAADTDDGAPSLQVEDINADIGHRYTGTMVPIRYPISNDGAAELRIVNVGAGCGCLASDRSWPERLAPGATGTIALTVDTSTLHGKVVKPLTVFSNDPDAPRTTLWIRGQVERLFTLEPSAIRFGRVGDGAPAAKTVTIRRVGAEPRQLGPLADAAGPFTCALRETQAGQEWRLQVGVAGPLAYGLNDATISIPTDHPGQRALMVEVTAYRAPPMQVIPPRLVVPARASVRGLRRVLAVRFTDADRWRFVDAVCTDQRIALKTVTTAAMTRLIVSIPADYVVSDETPVAIVINCRGPDAKTVQLRVPVVRS